MNSDRRLLFPNRSRLHSLADLTAAQIVAIRAVGEARVVVQASQEPAQANIIHFRNILLIYMNYS